MRSRVERTEDTRLNCSVSLAKAGSEHNFRLVTNIANFPPTDSKDIYIAKSEITRREEIIMMIGEGELDESRGDGYHLRECKS